MEHAAHHGDDVLYNSLPGGQARIRILTHLSEKPVIRPSAAIIGAAGSDSIS
jgi:hypothetical protein